MAGSSVKVLMALVVVSAAIGGEWVVSAQSHHVLGGDPGSWSSGRIFRVGDKICKPLSLSLSDKMLLHVS